VLAFERQKLLTTFSTAAMRISLRILHRLRMLELAQAPSTARLRDMCCPQRIGLVLALALLLCCPSRQSHGAESLECPEIGPGWVPDLIGDAAGGGLVTTKNAVDLANEINDSINRLQIASPNVSRSDMQNVLIAAYCRVVARDPGLGASEKWGRIRQFGNILEQQIAANTMPAGTLIIANVPLPPNVYRELRRQAVTSHEAPAQLMAAILARAAGK
jgi:hypothetical protein